MVKILRIFPKRNKATPDDELVRIGFPVEGDNIPSVDEIHVSVTFTYDKEKAEAMAEVWSKAMRIPTKIGGPAYDDPGGEFEPGKYLAKGNIITSRGCPRSCWFCMAAAREGHVMRELEIKDGWNVHDSNLLACSSEHIKKVFAMLKRQPERTGFVGGLDTKFVKPWIAEELVILKPRVIFLAYDTPDDREPFVEAMRMFREAGLFRTGHCVTCYVLIGYKNDTIEKAEARLKFVVEQGALPYAMLYRAEEGIVKPDWRGFQRQWCHPMITSSKLVFFKKHGTHLVFDPNYKSRSREA